MKRIFLILVACIIGISVTGCVGYSQNLSDEEIIKQIQTKMKEEFDKLHFTVDFSQYEFDVKVTQSFGSVGKVTVKDKRYNYDPVIVYDGAFGDESKNVGLKQEEIGTNPVIFVYHGYLNYLDEMSKETHQIVQKYLDGKGIKYQKTNFHTRDFSGHIRYPFSLEIKNGILQKDIGRQSEVFLWEEPKIAIKDYVAYYEGKNSLGIDYKEYDFYMSKGVMYYYALENEYDYLSLEKEVKSLIKQERIYIQIK